VRQVSLSVGFVLGRGRVQRACACACGVEDRIRGVASVNGCGLGYVLVAIYQQYAVTAVMAWSGRAEVVSRRQMSC
jgi:hypothetical protein